MADAIWFIGELDWSGSFSISIVNCTNSVYWIETVEMQKSKWWSEMNAHSPKKNTITKNKLEPIHTHTHWY